MDTLFVGISGINAVDNPGPGIGVARSLKEDKDLNVRIVGLAYDAMEPGIYMDWIVDKSFLYALSVQQRRLVSGATAAHPIQLRPGPRHPESRLRIAVLHQVRRAAQGAGHRAPGCHSHGLRRHYGGPWRSRCRTAAGAGSCHPETHHPPRRRVSQAGHHRHADA